MFDIHSHILPDILGDDGSNSIEMTIEMGKQLVKSGFTDVFATPHHIHGENNSSSKSIVGLVTEINDTLKSHGIDLTIHTGHEIYMDESIGQKLVLGEVLSLGDSKYVLIELPMHSIPFNFESVIFDLKLKGYSPVLAHPERNRCIYSDISIVDKYVEMGVLLQLNLRSLSGKYGSNVKQAASELIKKEYYSFVGSDGHNCTNRSMDVISEIKTLKSMTENKYFSDITHNNPRKILSGEVIASPVIVSTVKINNATKLAKMIGGFFGAKI